MSAALEKMIRSLLPPAEVFGNLTVQPEPDGTSLPWRGPILQAVLMVMVVLGTLAYLPSVLLALDESDLAVVIVDSCVFLATVALLLARGLPYRVRAVAALGLQYLLGSILLLAVGPLGAGPAWLFAFPVLAAVFLGRRAGILAIGATTFSLILVGGLALVGAAPWARGRDIELVVWIVLVSHFLLLDGAVTVAVSAILEGLDRAREATRITRQELEEERARLVASNENLARALRVQRRAERESGRLAAVVEQAAIPIVVTDPEGRIEYLNSAFSEITGLREEDIVGREVAETGCLGEAEQAREALETARARRTWRGRVASEPRGAPAYEAEVTAYALRDDRWTVTNVVIMLRDLTRQQALESQLQQAQKMEALGTLAGGIAHDFNNLLVPVMVNAQLARERLPDDDEARELLDEALQAADRARALVRQILTFSRRTDRERRPVPLTEVLDQFQGLLRASLPPGIEVRRVDEVADAVVFADPVEVHQVLVNLSANAGHAMRERGGVLTVKVDGCPPAGRPDGKEAGDGPAGAGWVHVSVADTGHGMDRRTLERVFEPFFTTKPAGQGTGLGLAVVHGIVQSLEGELSVESEPGRGTVVHVWLPRTAPVAATEAAVRKGPPLGNGEHVLLVDDDPGVLVATGRVLERLGYRVTSCKDGTEALERYSGDPSGFHVVLSDLSMPGLTGLQLAEEIERIGGTPVVLSTGYLDGLGRVGAEAAGVAGVLAKPFDVAALGEMLRTALEGTTRTPA